MPRVIGGRYGLSSKEFTPGMVAGVLEELARERPKRRFTIGINDDVSGTSLPYDAVARHRAAGDRAGGVLRPRLRRHGRREQEHDQDPRRRGGPARPGLLRLRLQEVRARRPSRTCASARSRSARRTSSRRPSFVGCHQFGLLERPEVLERAAPGATLLLNCRHPPDRGLGRAAAPGPGADPRQADRRSTSIDAGRIAREAGLAGRTNTVLQTCFFAISACSSASRRSSGSRPRSRRPTAGAAPRWSSATRPRSTGALDGLAPGGRCPSA